MTTQEAIRVSADFDLFALRSIPRGFRATIPFTPDLDLKLGHPFVVEAWEDAPQLEGTIRGFVHDLSESGRFSHVEVEGANFLTVAIFRRQAAAVDLERARHYEQIERERATENTDEGV